MPSKTIIAYMAADAEIDQNDVCSSGIGSWAMEGREGRGTANTQSPHHASCIIERQAKATLLPAYPVNT